MLEHPAQLSATPAHMGKFFANLSPAAQQRILDAQQHMLFNPEGGTAESAGLTVLSTPAAKSGPAAVPPSGDTITRDLHQVRVHENFRAAQTAEPRVPRRVQDMDPVVREAYQVLHRLASAHAQKHRRKFIGTYCFFTSNELLMDALGLKKTTFYQVLAALQATGLVYRKGWTSPIKNPTTGKAVCGGTLWAIVVDPNSSRIARLTWWDWHGGLYRDMGKVLTEKTSVHNFRTRHEQTLESLEKEMRYQILEGYTLSGVLEINSVTPVGSVCSEEVPGDPKELIFAIQDGIFLNPQSRGAWVDEMAQRLATLLRDRASVNLYRWVLWRLIEAAQHGRDYAQMVQSCLLSIFGDQHDQIPTNYGAVFVARLKKLGVWEELQFAWVDS